MSLDMATLIRLKRKACNEPADGLVVTLKKVKCDTDGVLFKFAATLDGAEDSLEKHIKEKKLSKLSPPWRNPKDTAINEDKIKKLREKLQAEHKNASEKKKLDYLNNKRLILNEDFFNSSHLEHTDLRQSYQLYDIIEENEDIKKQKVEEDSITCNNQPLIREKVVKDDRYVFDLYIADCQIDKNFLEEAVGVTPCTLTSDDIYFDDDAEESEEFEDEDDSNDENNWRNDYPDEMDSVKGDKSDHESYSGDEAEMNYDDLIDAFNGFEVDDDDEDNVEGHEGFSNAYSRRVMKELRDDYDSSDQDYYEED